MGSLSKTNGGGKKGAAKKTDREFRFINHTFTTAQEDDLLGYAESDAWGWDDIRGLVESGYSFKLARDSQGGGFRAHLVDNEPGSPDFNTCLSGRGSTTTDAVLSLLYRHFVLAEDGWGVLDEAKKPTKRFG